MNKDLTSYPEGLKKYWAKQQDESKSTQDFMEDNIIEKVVQEISKNHRQIIEDWCKAYMAQLYEEGHDIKPGCFTLNEQRDMVLENGKIGIRYWFSHGFPNYSDDKSDVT